MRDDAAHGHELGLVGEAGGLRQRRVAVHGRAAVIVLVGVDAVAGDQERLTVARELQRALGGGAVLAGNDGVRADRRLRQHDLVHERARCRDLLQHDRSRGVVVVLAAAVAVSVDAEHQIALQEGRAGGIEVVAQRGRRGGEIAGSVGLARGQAVRARAVQEDTRRPASLGRNRSGAEHRAALRDRDGPARLRQIGRSRDHLLPGMNGAAGAGEGECGRRGVDGPGEGRRRHGDIARRVHGLDGEAVPSLRETRQVQASSGIRREGTAIDAGEVGDNAGTGSVGAREGEMGVRDVGLKGGLGRDRDAGGDGVDRPADARGRRVDIARRIDRSDLHAVPPVRQARQIEARGGRGRGGAAIDADAVGGDTASPGFVGPGIGEMGARPTRHRGRPGSDRRIGRRGVHDPGVAGRAGIDVAGGIDRLDGQRMLAVGQSMIGGGAARRRGEGPAIEAHEEVTDARAAGGVSPGEAEDGVGRVGDRGRVRTDRRVGRGGVEGDRERRAVAGVAGQIGVEGLQRVGAVAAEGDARRPRSIALDDTGSHHVGAIEDGDGGADAVGLAVHVDRAGDGLARSIHKAREGHDGDGRGHRVERVGDGAALTDIAGRIGRGGMQHVVGIARERHVERPMPGAVGAGAAEFGRAVIDDDREACLARAGHGLFRLVGEPARARDRQDGGAGIDGRSDRRVTQRVAEIDRDMRAVLDAAGIVHPDDPDPRGVLAVRDGGDEDELRRGREILAQGRDAAVAEVQHRGRSRHRDRLVEGEADGEAVSRLDGILGRVRRHVLHGGDLVERQDRAARAVGGHAVGIAGRRLRRLDMERDGFRSGFSGQGEGAARPVIGDGGLVADTDQAHGVTETESFEVIGEIVGAAGLRQGGLLDDQRLCAGSEGDRAGPRRAARRDVEGAGIEREAAGEAVGTRERERARAVQNQAARAADGVGQGERTAGLDDERAGIGDRTAERGGGAERQRRAGGDGDAVGVALRIEKGPLAAPHSEGFEIRDLGQGAVRLTGSGVEIEGVGADAAVDGAADGLAGEQVEGIVTALEADRAAGIAGDRAVIRQGVVAFAELDRGPVAEDEAGIAGIRRAVGRAVEGPDRVRVLRGRRAVHVDGAGRDAAIAGDRAVIDHRVIGERRLEAAGRGLVLGADRVAVIADDVSPGLVGQGERRRAAPGLVAVIDVVDGDAEIAALDGAGIDDAATADIEAFGEVLAARGSNTFRLNAPDRAGIGDRGEADRVDAVAVIGAHRRAAAQCREAEPLDRAGIRDRRRAA